VLLWLVIVLLIGEFVMVGLLVAYLVIELLTATPTSFASAVALLVLAVIAAVWLGAIVVGALRGNAWIRSAALVWQVLQFGVGAAAIAGTFGSPIIGWPLVAIAILTVALLLSKPVVDATSHREDRAGS
jgi:hypothetical protein